MIVTESLFKISETALEELFEIPWNSPSKTLEVSVENSPTNI